MTHVKIRKQAKGYALVLMENVDGRWSEVRRIAKGIKTKKLAEKLKQEAEAQIAQRKIERAGLAPSTVTVSRGMSAYLRVLRDKAEKGTGALSSYKNAEVMARRYIEPTLGASMLADLSREDVQRWVDQLGEERGASTIHKAVGVLRAAYRHARKRGLFQGPDIFGPGQIDKPVIKRMNRHILAPDEMSPVIGEVPEKVRPFAAHVLLAGVRPSELVRCPPDRVDRRRRLIDLGNTKTGHERWVPISGDLWPYTLEALKHASADSLFPGDRGANQLAGKKLSRMLRAAMVRAAAKGHESLVTGWTLKCRRKGCGHAEHSDHFVAAKDCPACGFTLWPVGHARPVRFYDLRHTAATNMVAQGVPTGMAAKIMGHDERVLLSTYVHLRPEDLALAAERMGMPPAAKPAPVRPIKKRKRRKS